MATVNVIAQLNKFTPGNRNRQGKLLVRARVKKKPSLIEPQMRVQHLKGVGPKRAEQLARLGVERIYDLLYLLPRRYLDASQVTPVAHLKGPARDVTVAGTIVSVRTIRDRFKRKTGFEAVLDDGTGRITCSFFGRTFLENVMAKNQRWVLFGDLRLYRGRLYLNPVEYDRLSGGSSSLQEMIGKAGGIIPIYPLTEGLSQKAMRRITENALPAVGSLEEKLPEQVRKGRGLMGRREALLAVHRPKDIARALEGKRALAFDELFYLELMLLGRKLHIGSEKRVRPYERRNHLLRRLARTLPFTLTEAQKRVLRTIDSDLTGPHPLNRLIQGDVGSGKTVVAVIAALRAVENGYQAALMAPTEVLAEQHYRTLNKFLEPLQIEPVLLIGKLNARAKRQAAEKISSGQALIAVGTHALIQEHVEFADLGLVIIDEQHRFGVNQRLALRQKGDHTDCLVMTATPIPRSLALTLYGDLDVSTIDQMPAGRKKISTHIVGENKRADMQRFIGRRIAEGEQAYVVCPRIEEDEQTEQAAAEQWYARYRDEIFPELRVVLLHGRMKSEDKEEAMRAFETGEAQVLVGTTVIEVGIDVAAATVIVIEGAERFGLSQLHQLRGRVGRSHRQGWCLLVPSPDARGESLERLSILEATSDGFKISEEDLRLRGPGDFFGERQSGLPELRAADLIEDYPVLVQARRTAEKILETDPHLDCPEHRMIRKELISRFRNRVRSLRVG